MTPSDPLLTRFGERVRECRKRLGISQEELAFECKLDRTYVSQVERGQRNISLRNIKALADALRVPAAALLDTRADLQGAAEPAERYRTRKGFHIDCGFGVTEDDVFRAVRESALRLSALPFPLYQSIDLKTLSSIVGATFAGCLATEVDAIVNPIEKGHPDLIPTEGRNAPEAQLRNYPRGLEIKVTVGNVAKGSNLQVGAPRVDDLVGITWQAHHREVTSLLGLVVDFAGAATERGRYPIITAAFYADTLEENDWGKISGTTGRNTKVTGLMSSGKSKMGRGWILLFDDEQYLNQYAEVLGFTRPR